MQYLMQLKRGQVQLGEKEVYILPSLSLSCSSMGVLSCPVYLTSHLSTSKNLKTYFQREASGLARNRQRNINV
jgi:hypothetical protein